MENFGKKIKQLREFKNYGLRELAKIVGISPGYLSQLENGVAHGLPSEDTISKLAKALSYDKKELLIMADKLPSEVESDLKQQLKEGKIDWYELDAFLRKRRS